MKTNIQYRTFDELLDSVKIDLRGIDLEGMIDDQQLIKVAQRVNYELGLKLNPSRSKTIDIVNGKGKLPSDFYVLNFALFCGSPLNHLFPLDYAHTYNYKTFDQGILEGNYQTEQKLKRHMVRQYSESMTLNPGWNLVKHNLNTKSVMVQIRMPDNTMLSFDFRNVDLDTIEIMSELSLPIEEASVLIIGGDNSKCFDDVICPPKDKCVIVQPKGCDASLTDFKNGRRVRYQVLTPFQIVSSKSVTPECINMNSHSIYHAYLKNNFFVTNIEEGTAMLNYKSLMEDDEGNLLVLSHPLVDEFYEYALKQRIYENLIMAGENMSHLLQLVENRFRVARTNALSFINTPDFLELHNIWKMNKRAMHSKYYDMFKRSPTGH